MIGQKRKAEEDLSPNPPSPLSELEPLDQVSKAREELGALLISDKKNGAVNFDIEQNIREIRAILKMNAEIFDRCIQFIMTNASNKSTTFARIRFSSVQVREWEGVINSRIENSIYHTTHTRYSYIIIRHIASIDVTSGT